MSNFAAHITGLPRTKTCWLSMVINAHAKEHGNYSTVEGYHELLSKVESFVEYESIMYNPYVPLVVDCASAIRYKTGDKLVVVHRPIGEVVESLSKLPALQDCAAHGVLTAMQVLESQIHQLVRGLKNNPRYEPDLLEISFAELHTRAGVAQVLDHIGITPNFAIIEQWLPINIQAQYMNTVNYEEFIDKGRKTLKIINEGKANAN